MCDTRFFFFNDTATTEIYTLPLHDALPISPPPAPATSGSGATTTPPTSSSRSAVWRATRQTRTSRSEEHTSELQSRQYLVCRLLLEKKKKQNHDTSCQQVSPTDHTSLLPSR